MPCKTSLRFQYVSICYFFFLFQLQSLGSVVPNEAASLVSGCLIWVIGKHCQAEVLYLVNVVIEAHTYSSQVDIPSACVSVHPKLTTV
jgi:hypothetical protein